MIASLLSRSCVIADLRTWASAGKNAGGRGNDMEIAVWEGSKGRGYPPPLFQKKKNCFPKCLDAKWWHFFI